MTSPYKVFHRPCEEIRGKLHVILVRPKQGGNIGAAARAIKNMGILGRLIIVGGREVLNDETRKFAKHAFDIVESASFAPTLQEAMNQLPEGSRFLASTSRIGSAERPHPIEVAAAVPREVERISALEVPGVAFVFGPEPDGLSNDEVALCQTIVTIPSSPRYRSVNLSQSVLIFCYEANKAFNGRFTDYTASSRGQRDRLIKNLLLLAEEVEFILPGDPHKMRTKLEGLLLQLPKHVPDAPTLHGLIDQIRRSCRRGAPDVKGRYRTKLREPSKLRRLNHVD